LVSQTLLPLMSIYLALCIAGGLSTELNIAALCAAVKRTITWSLGFLTTIFVGVLSVQTMVTGSADSLAVRASKFVISGFVPVVGSALSEAMLAAQGCLKLIRASVGAFGIAAALFIFLPVFLKVLIWMGVTNLAAMCSDLLGVKEVSGILRSCSSVLGILISFLLCYALLMIVAVTVVMVTGLGRADNGCVLWAEDEGAAPKTLGLRAPKLALRALNALRTRNLARYSFGIPFWCCNTNRVLHVGQSQAALDYKPHSERLCGAQNLQHHVHFTPIKRTNTQKQTPFPKGGGIWTRSGSGAFRSARRLWPRPCCVWSCQRAACRKSMASRCPCLCCARCSRRFSCCVRSSGWS
jgi:hypothetical protein